MTLILKTLTGLLMIGSVTLYGCEQDGGHGGDSPHSHDGEHSHDEAVQDMSDDQDTSKHGEWTPLGTIEVSGVVLAVSVEGEVRSGGDAQFEISQTAGPSAAAVRLWIGSELGIGAMKSKADGHDGHFHGHAEAPADLVGAALWVEVETDSGERFSGSLPLQ